MTIKAEKCGTKVHFRHSGDRSIFTRVFRGDEHAIKAAQFIVSNKKEWDYHLNETIYGGRKP